MMLAVDQDTVQVCPPQCPIQTPCDRTIPLTGTSRRSLSALSLQVTRQRHCSSFPFPPSLSLYPNVTGSWSPTRSTSFPSSDSLHHPCGTAHASPTNGRELVAHVLIQPLPPGALNSDYATVGQWHRTRNHRAAGISET